MSYNNLFFPGHALGVEKCENDRQTNQVDPRMDQIEKQKHDDRQTNEADQIEQEEHKGKDEEIQYNMDKQIDEIEEMSRQKEIHKVNNTVESKHTRNAQQDTLRFTEERELQRGSEEAPSKRAKRYSEILQHELKYIYKDAEIQLKGDKYFVYCKPCKAQFSVGSSNKWGSFRRHMTQSVAHVAYAKGGDEPDVATKAFEKVTDAYKSTFIRKGGVAVCRDCGDTLSLTAKNILKNADKHVKSQKHNAPLVKASSIKLISDYMKKKGNTAKEEPKDV